MKIFIIILFSFFLFGNGGEVFCQDIYEYAFQKKLIQSEKIKSVKITTKINKEVETDLICFDNLGNEITTILYSNLNNDTSYFYSEYNDTLILLEYLIKNDVKNDTTFIAKYVYNKSNRLEKKEDYFLNDKNEISQVSTYQYDEAGKVKNIRIKNNKNEAIQNYQYDEQNRLLSITQSEPRIISKIQYEYLKNKIIKKEFLRESGDVVHINTSTFDNKGKLIEETKNQINQYKHTFKYLYKNNLLINIINADGSKIDIEYQYF